MAAQARQEPSIFGWLIALAFIGAALGFALNRPSTTASAQAPLTLSASASAAHAVTSAAPAATDDAADDSPFARLTVDFGIVCSDVDRSVKFYTDVIGCTEVKGFSVGGEILGDAGLTDYKPGSIRVVMLGEGKDATHIKLMKFADAPGKPADQSFIHSTIGLSYITVFVKDENAALARAAKHGVKPLNKGPADLGNGMFLAVVKDPDGNFIELVGPKK
jgi:lactoylglutathione lyase